MALFIDKRGYDIQVATRDDVLIRESGKVLIGKALKASIRIGDQWYQGLINPESYAKYKRWKAAGDALEVVRAVEEEPEPGDEGFYEKRVP